MNKRIEFEVGQTGPDHEPTAETKWYAQIQLVTYDMIPVGLQTFQFGPTPEKALSNLVCYLEENGVQL